MQWTDRIRQVKIFLVLAAVVIAVTSLVISNIFVKDLAKEERNKMEVWAEAMRSFNMADETTDLGLVLKVMNENHTIPVIVLDSNGAPQICRNLEMRNISEKDSIQYVKQLGHNLFNAGRYIRISLDDTNKNAYIDVCYDDSTILTLGLLSVCTTWSGFDICCCSYIRFAYFQTCRAEQGVGRVV